MAAAKKKSNPSKSTRVEDMRVKTDDQLQGDLADLKREQFNLRFQAATNQIERPARIKEVRRDIARIKTLQTARTAAAKASAQKSTGA